VAAGLTLQDQVVLTEFVGEFFDFESAAHLRTLALCGCEFPRDNSYSVPTSGLLDNESGRATGSHSSWAYKYETGEDGYGRRPISVNAVSCIGMATKKKPLAKATFIETMDCLAVSNVPRGAGWTYEVKLDGYRLQAVKTGGKVTLYSRRRNVLNRQFGRIADALADLPDETVLDGEVVAVDDKGRANFNLLQNSKTADTRIHYYAFDVLMHKGKLLIEQPLEKRREILAKILPRNNLISLAAVGHDADQMLSFVKGHTLEGIVAKRTDSHYEPGMRSGLWSKYRINLRQDFVIGGVTAGNPFDALVVGVYSGRELLFAGRVRAGFVPATRRQVMARLKPLEIAKCPFANLPEKVPGRFGEGITAEKMRSCTWFKPLTVVCVEFVEWTDAKKLRHTKFLALKDGVDPRTVVREP
jgi:DNA ligase D-like protein (predicted ligase)